MRLLLRLLYEAYVGWVLEGRKLRITGHPGDPSINYFLVEGRSRLRRVRRSRGSSHPLSKSSCLFRQAWRMGVHQLNRLIFWLVFALVLPFCAAAFGKGPVCRVAIDHQGNLPHMDMGTGTLIHVNGA